MKCSAASAPLLVTAVLIAAAPLHAQERDDVHHRNACRLAAQVIDTGEPHTKRVWAWEQIQFCPEVGPETLARSWAVPPVTEANLVRLVIASSGILDRRVFDAVAAEIRVALQFQRPGKVTPCSVDAAVSSFSRRRFSCRETYTPRHAKPRTFTCGMIAG